MRAILGGKSLVFGLLAGVITLSALPLAAPSASAGWLEESGLSFIESSKPDPTPSPFSYLDLSVVRDGTESALRVPLAPGADARGAPRLGRLGAYVSGG